MKDLKEIIEDAIDDYIYKKTHEIAIDEDTSFEIFKAKRSAGKRIGEILEELDDEVDDFIQQMNEPSDYEYDLAEDNRSRLKDLA